ncbi:hypothetical protein LCGC14_2583950 [marine sediment metagenome]|uniref:Uncharacterized protein n=1 Tax=marine sediment metagenome TaxID=412755 RepID=A0A0F9ADI7_9ZZZZ
MGYRRRDGSWHDSCLEKLKMGEPFFVLRAQDKLAPNLIRTWAREAEEHGCLSTKTDEALNAADEMEKWKDRKFPD